MTPITISKYPSTDSVTSDYSIQSHFFDHHIIRFEDFPLKIRNKLYKHLLIKTYNHDIEFDNDEDEETRVNTAFGELMIDPIYEPGIYGLHPAILRTNKKIHAEAAMVLWGENYFTWSLDGDGFDPLWHEKAMFGDPMTRKVSVRYSRLITKMHLRVTVRGDWNDLFQTDAIYWTTINLNQACKKLSVNHLKILNVDFFNPLSRRQGRDEAQRCLEPLKKVMAQKFIINMFPSPTINKLKAIIEGPEDADFLTWWASRMEAEGEAEDSLEVEVAHEHDAFGMESSEDDAPETESSEGKEFGTE